jgi:hypothetical protein
MNSLEKKVITEVKLLLESFDTYQIYKALYDFADLNKLECKKDLLETYGSAMNEQFSKIRNAKGWLEEIIKDPK